MIENSPSAEACLPEAARITSLMESAPAFSLLRLGDGELSCMLAVKNGKAPPRYRYDEEPAASIETTFSVSGIEPRHFHRLFEAFEHCTYLDYCNSIPYIEQHVGEAGINRNPALYRNPSRQASNVIFAWTAHELPRYLGTHRSLFASAESALLRELCQDPTYHEASGGFWPPGAPVFFHQIRNNGRFFSENLDLIKEDLRAEIERTGCDSLFLSLATGAKILCYELAKEMRIRAIDFGSMTRALAYAGTPGYHGSRSFHNPFMFRVPFAVFMSALERAHPEIDVPTLISKAHGQLALEIQDLQPLRFNEPDVLTRRVDLRPQRLSDFKLGLRCYNRRYRVRAVQNPKSSKLHRDFVRWRRKMGIGWDGKIFVSLVKLKGLLRRALGTDRVSLRKAPPVDTASSADLHKPGVSS